jgi:hypothetical protein
VPSAFEAELPEFFAAVGEAHEQVFVWTPMCEAADVNSAPAVDTSRGGGRVRGIFFDKQAKPEIPHGFDPRSDLRPGAIAGMSRIEILPDRRTGYTPPVERLDILVAESGARWSVVSVFQAKTGVKVCPVNAL